LHSYPEEAIRMNFDPQLDVFDALLARISTRAHIGPQVNVCLNSIFGQVHKTEQGAANEHPV
jgi:hypothetical protein